MSKGVTIPDLCRLTKRERRTIERRLTGVVPREDGTYESHKALTAIYAKDFEQKKAVGIDVSEARIYAANARTAEVKASKAEEKVIESAIVDLAWSETGIYVARGCEIIPSKVESRFVPGMTGAQVGELVRQEIHDVLSELSKPITYQESSDAEEAAESVSWDAEAEAKAAD